ncbi:MAG: hypothetical protein H6738_11115 [Alphaproteobacteria bacterium]|nr:hypothetical protein [Alphaproteobacteria bacterium]MCB9697319.1 hypothetical protein [Alphaproteobacteria bacterium]
MAGAPHLSLSLSRELWRELLGAALPVKLAGDSFDVARDARRLVKQLGVRDRVAGLLEDRQPPAMLVRAKDRAKEVWVRRKPGVYRRINELVRIEGEWKVDLDHLGTDLRYSKQKVAADAYVRGVAEGTVYLLKENVEFPFRIERRIGASVALGDIRYDPGHRAIIGSVQDLGVYIGDNAVLQLLSRLAEWALDQQLPRVNPVPILPRERVEDLFGPIGGPLKMQLGVEDLELEITEDDLKLKVRFGFTRAQLTDSEHADAE